MHQEPRVDFRDVGHFVDGGPELKCVPYLERAIPIRPLQAGANFFPRSILAVTAESGIADLQTLPCLLQALGERTADCHDLTHCFHLGGELFIHTFEFLEVEARNLSHNIDRKSSRLNSSHVAISYAVFCLKKKTESTINRMN